MVARKARRHSKKLANLPAETLSAKRANGIKGGVIAIITTPRADLGAGLLLPAVQKVRE